MIGNQYQALENIAPFEKGELFSITNEGKGDFVVRTTHIVEFGKIVREKDVSRHIKQTYFRKLEWNDSIRLYKSHRKQMIEQIIYKINTNEYTRLYTQYVYATIPEFLRSEEWYYDNSDNNDVFLTFWTYLQHNFKFTDAEIEFFQRWY